MPNHRGSRKQPNGSRRGQAPTNRGRGQGQTSKFADYSQPEIMGYTDADDFLVLNFNDMSVLTGSSNGAIHGSRGRGARGARHFIPGPTHQILRGQYTPPRGRAGRGRGGYKPIPMVVGPPPSTPPRPKPHQNGRPFFRGRGGGLGFVLSPEKPVPKNWELSTRPLLKPIKFVCAAERLFEADPEELLQAHKMPPLPTDQLDPQTEVLAEAFEDGGQSISAMPTVNNSGQETPSSGMEIVINDKSHRETTIKVNSGEQTQYPVIETRATAVQEDLLAILLDASAAAGTVSDPNLISKREEATDPTSQKENNLFWVDTSGQAGKGSIPIHSSFKGTVVGDADTEEPDEIILVPTPAARRAKSMGNLRLLEPPIMIPNPAAVPTIVSMETLSLNFTKKEEDTSTQNKSLKSFSIPKSGRSPFVPPRARKEAQRRKRDEAWKNGLGSVFGFKDGREGWRKGDSDLDVGSGSAEELEDNGMTIDGDLDATAMARFAREVNQQQMSMDDVVIEAALRAGDYDSDNEDDNDSDDSEDDDEMELGVDIVFEKGEGEEGDEDDEDWSSDDDDVDATPRTSFKSRLKRVRERTPADMDSDEAERAINDAELSWADRDEDFIAEIQDILDENAGILGARGKKANRKARSELFRAIQDGDANHPFTVLSSRYKNSKDAPDILAEQWMRDRNKKAERKRQREQERMLQGGLGGGKSKGKNRGLDLEEVEQMMRELLFSTDPGATKSFELPAMDKPTRVKVHAMAQALHLKSTSSGKKNSDHKMMTISRAKNSGLRPVNEGKMDVLMKRKKGSGKYGVDVHIKEGDVIGHKAAKIDEGNIGYRLLAQMGWAEGDKIGREGGLEAPIVAIMKKSKLGLGASWA